MLRSPADIVRIWQFLPLLCLKSFRAAGLEHHFFSSYAAKVVGLILAYAQLVCARVSTLSHCMPFLWI